MNSEGLRGPETTVEKAPGLRRVAVLGDSIAFGYWVAERDAFPRQLEAMMNESAGPGERVEVLDFGVPGYNLDQEIETLRSEGACLLAGPRRGGLLPERPRGDLLLRARPGAGPGQARSLWLGRLREELLGRSLLFSWVEYRRSELQARRSYVRARNPLDGPLYAEAVTRQRAALEGKLAVLHALLVARGIPGVVVVFPVLGARWERYPYRDLHRAVVLAAEAAGLAAVDLFDCYSVYDFRDLRVDVVHPSPLGHRVAAHALRDALCARGWLCPVAPTGPPCTAYRPSDFPAVRGY